MESNLETNAQKHSKEDAKEKKKIKNDRFKWWQATLLLLGTLVICLSAGYYISEKYLWNQDADQLSKQLAYYKAQVDQKPNNSNLRVNLGFAYFLKGDDQNAINQYKMAKDLDKNNYSAFLNLAIVYDKENDTDNALQMANKAAKLVPNDYKSQLLLGRSYRKLKLYSKAMTALQNANRLKPDNTDVIYEAGLVAEEQGKVAQAEQIFKQTLSFDPTYKPAQEELDRLKSKTKK